MIGSKMGEIEVIAGEHYTEPFEIPSGSIVAGLMLPVGWESCEMEQQTSVDDLPWVSIPHAEGEDREGEPITISTSDVHEGRRGVTIYPLLLERIRFKLSKPQSANRTLVLVGGELA